MTDADLGGDPPCWAHLTDTEDPEAGSKLPSQPLPVNLETSTWGSGGVVWSLPHGGDLDANLVRLEPGDGVGAHTNDEVDVLIIVQSGSAEISVDENVVALEAAQLVLVPKGAQRSIKAGNSGIAYLSVHRRRAPLGIKSKTAEVRR